MISSAIFNAGHQHTVCAMITSKSSPDWPSDVRIENWREAGLTVPCHVRFKVFTLDQSLIRGRIGALSATDANAVRAQLTHLLGNI